MKRYKLVSVLLLIALLLTALTACSDETDTEAGLPILYIDGEAYPVTAEDGVLGLEKVHGGVLSLRSAARYDEKLDADVLVDTYTLYRADGSVEEDWQGERKLTLGRQLPTTPDVSDLDSTLRTLSLTASGTPFRDAKVSDEAEFQTLMEQNGFILSDEYYAYYTENGKIDVTTSEFLEQAREYVRNSKAFSGKSDDSAWVEEQISDNPWIRVNTAYSLALQELREGRSRILCQLEVTYDAETGKITTEVGIIAPEDLMNSWYTRWSPNFGDQVCQKN